MIVTLEELPGVLTDGRRLLCLDLGTKTIGMAVSDPGLTVASPIDTIRRGRIDADVASLARVMAEYSIGALVLGLPLNMDGTEGPRAQATRAFVRNLRHREATLPVPVRAVLWDERLSTAAVQRFMTDEADMTRKRRGEVVDKMAAAFILQGALDALSHLRRRVAEAEAEAAETGGADS